MTNAVPFGLRMLSDSLDDMEALRIATENRYRAATRDEADSDGEFRGLGLTDEHPLVLAVGQAKDNLILMENALIKTLQKEVRKTPFGDWIKVQPGIGEKQAARLLAVIGDPYMNERTGEPRTLRQLWGYSALAVNDEGTARRISKGMTQEELFAVGKPTIKMRAYLVATSCVKAKGKFRDIYDETRAKYADAVHNVECKRCGPTGKPAQPGSPLSLGHQHARALRKVSKEVLRDMWIISREYHLAQAEVKEPVA